MVATQNKVKAPFQTLFAVPMTCDHCVKSVSDSLYSLEGITKVDVSLKDQLVTVEGTAGQFHRLLLSVPLKPPGGTLSYEDQEHQTLTQIPWWKRLTGAAVCILETYHHNLQGGDGLVPASAAEAATADSGVKDRKVKGLARMVQVSPEATLVDLTVRGVTPGVYSATIREYGDLKYGATSTGPAWAGGGGTTQPRGVLGTVEVGKDGRGAVFLDHPFQVWEVIGHAMVVSRQEEGNGDLKNDEDTVVGVIARSAGVWDNDKTVCSCTGKTLWEERKDEVKKGMI
ncbi:hypothetical protein DL768_005062 [Monosporascus sp. mg162]|nr:hypothetical protein DL768_005062 [Monosporascus sp. mg162]